MYIIKFTLIYFIIITYINSFNIFCVEEEISYLLKEYPDNSITMFLISSITFSAVKLLVSIVNTFLV